MSGLTRFSSPELLKLPDCCGLQESGKCKWLDVPSCRGTGCAHYMKKDGREKGFERLRDLDERKQAHIARKYYRGSRPWDEAENTARL